VSWFADFLKYSLYPLMRTYNSWSNFRFCVDKFDVKVVSSVLVQLKIETGLIFMPQTWAALWTRQYCFVQTLELPT
jgi:hypothetical protein